jgi:hypothetical protein
MEIDIDRLNESELIDLNLRIVARLRLLWQIEAHNTMAAFKIGDKVTLRREGRAPLTGIITRHNKKTVSVVARDGRVWNVSPWLLQKVESRKVTQHRHAHRNTGNVVMLRRSEDKTS